MIRKLSLVLLLPLAGLMVSGCPTTPGADTGNLPPGDPNPETTPALSITSTASILQFNAIGLPTPQFRDSADLLAVLSNVSSTATVTWTITTSGTSFLAFRVGGATSSSASGATVTVVATASPPDDVTHVITATANLGAQGTLTAQILIVVTPDPIIGGESSVLSVNPFATPPVGLDTSGQVLLSAGVTGEQGSAVFVWSPVDPASLPLDDPATPACEGLCLPADLTTATITLSFGTNVSGVFPFRVNVTDALGNRDSAIVNVYVGIVDLTLDVLATRVQTVPPASVSLRTIRAGGIADLTATTNDTYAYTWQVLDEGNNLVPVTFNPSNGITLDANIIDWTVTGLVTPGTYRFVATVRDRVGHSTTTSIPVLFTNGLGLTVEPTLAQVGVNRSFSLRTVRGGGQPGFTYTFSVFDSSNNDVTGLTTFTPPSGTQTSFATNDWGVSGLATADTYRFFATVTDGASKSFTASTVVRVGDILTLDARAASNIVSPGAATTLTFTPNGGVPPYVFSYVTGAGAGGTPIFSDGSPEPDVGDPDVNGPLSVGWTAPGIAFQGSYRTDVIVTDAVGNTATDSVVIEVRPAGGGNFVIDVQAGRLQLAPPAAMTTYNLLLRTVRTGGVTPVPTGSYVWTVRDSGGTAIAGITVAPNVAGSTAAELDWNVTLPAGLSPDTYRFFVTATDAATNTSTGSAEILIADILTLDVRTRTSLLAPGVPTEITAVANGGSGIYQYSFTAVDMEGGAPAGTFSMAAPVPAATATTVYVPPSAGSGTYRVTVTARDTTLNTTAARTVNIFVTSSLAAHRILNAPAPELDLSPAGAGSYENDGDFFAIGGGAASVTLVPTNQNPLGATGTARSLTYRITNPGGGLNVSVLAFIGTNQRGEVIAEVVDPVEGSFGSTITSTTAAFRTLDRIELAYTGGLAAHRIQVGIGEWFGLSAPFPTTSEAAADRAFHIVAFYTDLTGNGENATFLDPENNAVFATTFAPAAGAPATISPDRQSVLFSAGANRPDGTRDYILQFAPDRPLTLELDTDAVQLDVVGGDVANLNLHVIGGVPPYSFNVDDFGQRDLAASIVTQGTGTFSSASFTNEFSDVRTVYMPPVGGADRTHVIHARVLDSAGNAATASVLIFLDE